jgi:catechol 2,3-dioxygenase-like lactoylglutathione lyase family enzyme
MTTLTAAKVRATIAVKDRDRARHFYQDTLGLTVENESPEVVTFRGLNDTVLDVYESDFAGTAKNTVASFQVSDLDAAAAELRERGVTFEDYSAGDPNAGGGIVERGGVRGAWFRDPDRNILGLIQLSEAAR